MIGILKSEFTKLVTLRSFYVINGLLALMAIVVGAVVTLINGPGLDFGLTDAVLMSATQAALGLYVTVLSIMTALTVIGEYRHNTMATTVVSGNNRLYTFLSKSIVALVYGWMMGLVVALVAIASAAVVAGATGLALSSQPFDAAGLFGHEVVHILCYALAGLFLGFIIRNVVIALVILFLLPSVESTATLVLRDVGQFLPFQAFGATARIGDTAASVAVFMTALAYVVALGVTAYILFSRRDA